jgi:HAD superfamily hydrolase (TIGR01549 family)
MTVQNELATIKAIFFDTSDTLYRNDDLEAEYPRKLIQLIAVTRGVSNEEAKRLLEGATEKLKSTEKHVTKVRAAAELGIGRSEVHEKAFCKVRPSDFLVKDHELDAVMQRLSGQYALGIISNLKKSHMIEVLDALGLSHDHFTYYVTEDVVQEIKPALEPFLTAIELSGYLAKDCLYIGDSPTKDMQPAKEAGMTTILVSANPTDEDMKNADGAIVDVHYLEGLMHLPLKDLYEGRL